ncbi:trans-acting enoyl reductase family protein [Lewinella sp. 4G2]|uniref:saccharopine dehydrogenase family protein n=1 Tax=Lewinella sp. 4G2 TaxID=1803372 RepID=UPI0007B461BC|nr:saccharopine dehydrogenase NADP-binding domain-containing protein [Lewinella sp. 4G2]OAV43504.1 hypothetical protein A3850_002890 [Lewinella sp. 4G2]
MNDFVLYGAYGYTGRLITERAAAYGLRPLLCGRNEEKLKPLAAEKGLDYRAVSLSDTSALEALLADYPLVLHAAGPFSQTAAPMLAACLATGTHYLDITGEIDVFAHAASLSNAFAEAGLMAMPGVGFDVVPTDCIAAFCHQQLPDATELVLAFAWKGGSISHGTAQTMLESLGHPGKVRRNGEIQDVPGAYKTETFPFTKEDELRAVTIPWGDVFTAYHTTGIPNVETYFAVPTSQIQLMKMGNYLGPLLRSSFVKNFLKKRVADRPAGPGSERRERAESYVYGRATNAKGETFAARLRTIEGYTLTAETALMITKRVLDGDLQPGYQTPAGCYGADLILKVEGTTREVL